MILIRVRGDTFSLRKRFKDHDFRWDNEMKEWWRVVAEASLNHTLESFRPMYSWSDNPTANIVVILSTLDVNGKAIGKKTMGIKLLPKCLAKTRDFYDEYQRQ